MIESCPKVELKQLLHYLIRPRHELIEMARKCAEDYIYWDKVKYKGPLPEGVNSEDLWAYVKAHRMRMDVQAWASHRVHFGLTEYMQRACQQMDMNFGGRWGQDHISSKNERQMYLISSLMEEAISSSQIEGASTTRAVATDMIRKALKPQNKDQRMILNNYRAIHFIVEHQQDPLSLELLLQLHAQMTEGTLEREADVGRLRTNEDDVVVENSITHEVVHRPPGADALPSFIKKLCSFFNDEDKEAPYIHPIIRAIIIHFMIGYMHPFVDGNGRTARALFYWYMMKKGYWLIQYLSISHVIKKSKKAYETAYLYSEHDDLDIGYFITYHLNVLNKAFKDLQDYIQRKQEQRNHAQIYMQMSGINERQASIIQHYTEKPDRMLTIKEVEGRYQITATTAKTDLDGLVQMGLVEKIELNRVKRGYIRSPQFEEILSGKLKGKR